jgi:hypothetical protein
VLLNIGPKCTDDQIRVMMRTISDTGDINFEQFKSYVENNPEMFQRRLGALERVFHTLEEPSTSVLAKIVSIAVMILIFISCGAFVIESLPGSNVLPENCRLGVGGAHSVATQCAPEPKGAFAFIETICVIAFSIEYGLRMSLYPFETTNLALRAQFMGARGIDEDAGKAIEKQSQLGSWRRQLNYMTSTMNLVDLVSIAPFYVEMGVNSENGVGLTFFRVLRLARVFRIFKMGKYAEGMGMLGKVMKLSAPAFTILLFFAVIGCIFFGALIFFFESGEYFGPDAMCFPQDGMTCADAGYLEGAFLRFDLLGKDREVSPFISIPHCFWWVLTTATTVGYGDLYPTSGGGKFIGATCMTLGIVVLALPISVVGANFASEYNKREREKEMDRMLARGDTMDASGSATPEAGHLEALGQPMEATPPMANASWSKSTAVHKIHPSATSDAMSGDGSNALDTLKEAIAQCNAAPGAEDGALNGLTEEVVKLEQTKALDNLTGAHIDRFLIGTFATISCQAALAGNNAGAAGAIAALRVCVLQYAAELAGGSGNSKGGKGAQQFES